MSLSSPYETSRPITDPELLGLRWLEVALALDTVSPDNGDACGHAAILGDHRTGRTSVLREVARRALDERKCLPVHLRPNAQQLSNPQSFVRHLMLSAVEAVASQSGSPPADWYLAWRERVYLGSSAPISHRDQLASGLVFARGNEVYLDPILLEQDLRTLLDLSSATGFPRLVVCVDNASDLTQDTDLVEELAATFDAAGGWSLLLAGLPLMAQHFLEAVSPCLRSFQPVTLMPLRPQEVMTCLAAPLDVQDRHLIEQRDVALARDVMRLTGGNAFEVMLVAHHMWAACQIGEIDRYTLTPRVLERVVNDLAVHTSGGEALLDGAKAIRRLDPDQVPTALELVAFSRLSVRQIAVAKALEVVSRDVDRVRRDVSPEVLDEIAGRVRDSLEMLDEAGVIELTADGERFSVRGGRPASVVLQYEAGGAQDRPFDLSFLLTVGRPIARDVFSRAADGIEGVRRLSVGLVESTATTPTQSSAHRAVADLAHDGSLEQIARGDLNLLAWTKDEFDRSTELIAEATPSPIALISATVAHGRAQLEYVELWELPPSIAQHELDQHLAEAVEGVMPSVEISELRWRGLEAAVVSGVRAREALILLEPFAADRAVTDLFRAFRESGDSALLDRATTAADASVRTFQAHSLPRWVNETLLSVMLSKLGFLESFDDERLSAAEEHLREALRLGVADGWVTNWNLANVLVRTDRAREAEEALARVGEQTAEAMETAHIVFFAPSTPASDSVITVTPHDVDPVLRLQRAMVACAMQGSPPENLRDLLDACVATEQPGALTAVALAEQAAGVKASVRPTGDTTAH